MTLFSQKSLQLLAYVDDINIIGYTKRDVTIAFSAIERESTKMSLTLNEGKIICYRQEGTYGILILGLRPIAILLIQLRNLFTLVPLLPPKIMSVRRSNVGSVLSTGSIMVSIAN